MCVIVRCYDILLAILGQQLASSLTHVLLQNTVFTACVKIRLQYAMCYEASSNEP